MYVALAFLGVVLDFFLSYCVGIFAFLYEDATPFEWVYGKFLLIFGGTLLPIDLFPEGWEYALKYLPFSNVIFAPARTLVVGDVEYLWRTALVQFIWIVTAMVLGMSGFSMLRHRVVTNGG